MSNIQHIIDKVSKLRALAARAGTLAEAEAAAAQAEAIIAKHRLSEADLESASAEPTPTPEEHDPLWSGSRRDAWRHSLATVLAKHYGCYTWCHRVAGGQRFRIVGTANDVAIVRYMFAWLSAEIDRLSTAESGKAARNAFRRGAVAGVYTTLRDAAGAVQRQSTSSAAMVLADRGTASKALAESIASGKLRSMGSSRINDGGAYNRGHAAGFAVCRYALEERAEQIQLDRDAEVRDYVNSRRR